MYLSYLRIKNFRCFEDLEISFNPGLTVLVGENDSGKSAIIDAVRLVLGTTDFVWRRIESNDFYKEDITSEIEIICKFSDLSPSEQADFLECLTYEQVENKMIPCLYLHWTCKYLTNFKPPRTTTTISTGKDGNGPQPFPEARERLRATYLKPLRDSYSDLQSGKSSRLSKIIQNIPNITKGEAKFEKGKTKLEDLSLIGIADLSNQLLEGHHVLGRISKEFDKILNNRMLLKNDLIRTRFKVTGSDASDNKKLISLLEKLDLVVDKESQEVYGEVGLGTSNVMSMACELLLYQQAEEINKSSILLIEEPEAHIHAQRQLKLIKSLETEADKNKQQIIITTHSPLLASTVKLKNIIILKDGYAYPLAEEKTKLDDEDYLYLEKYLDATKANLFFARSVMIVEGPGEALLLPTVSELLGWSFTDYGVSLVDVRGRGLRRYARIFQRTEDNTFLKINVACVTDRDIMPDCAPKICFGDNNPNRKTESNFTNDELEEHVKNIKQKTDGQFVKTFVSNHWTLEYDLAFAGICHNDMKEALINALAQASSGDNTKQRINNEIDKYSSVEEKAAYFYSYFTKKGVSKAEFSQRLAHELEKVFFDRPDELREALPNYLVEAIKYVTVGDNDGIDS